MDGSSADRTGAPADLFAVLDEGRRRFLAVVADLRPELLRYCARMTGSVADGEDVVQDTLARAYYELSQMAEMPPLRPWLFAIAHHRAVDRWRRESHRETEPLDAANEVADDAALEPENAAARRQAVHAALSSFLALAPAQRACVILKDVLDHSLDEIAAELTLSVAAVKSALHRGRVALRDAAATTPARPRAPVSPQLIAYARLFGAHDWDGLRALLADDVRLDLVAQRKAAGRRAVGSYFANYERSAGWRVAPGWFDGCEALGVWTDVAADAPSYVIVLAWRDGRVSSIRDFRYARYVLRDIRFERTLEEENA